MVTVRCPNCDAAYELDPAKLAGGRKLKCAKCGTMWVPTVEVAKEEPKVEAPKVEEAAQAEVPAGAAKPAAEAPPAPEPEEDDEPVPEIVLPQLDTLARQRKMGLAAYWLRGDNRWITGTVALVVLGLLGGALVVWQRMAPEAPAEAASAKALESGPVLTVVEPPKGLVLHNVRSEVVPQDGGGVLLTVRGLIANTTSASITVPPLRLELLDGEGKVADMWPVSSVSGSLPAQSENAWVVSLTEASLQGVSGWRLVFTGWVAKAGHK